MEKVKEAVADNPHIKHILLVAGFPCQDLSGANPAAKGLSGKRSSLLHHALKLLRELLPAAFPGVEIEAILENVSSMKATYRDDISTLCDTVPYKFVCQISGLRCGRTSGGSPTPWMVTVSCR